jgi:hypothetical protein
VPSQGTSVAAALYVDARDESPVIAAVRDNAAHGLDHPVTADGLRAQEVRLLEAAFGAMHALPVPVDVVAAVTVEGIESVGRHQALSVGSSLRAPSWRTTDHRHTTSACDSIAGNAGARKQG